MRAGWKKDVIFKFLTGGKEAYEDIIDNEKERLKQLVDGYACVQLVFEHCGKVTSVVIATQYNVIGTQGWFPNTY